MLIFLFTWHFIFLFLSSLCTGLVTPVKKEVGCDGHRIFALVGAIEICFKTVTKKEIIISEQQFIDCVSYTACGGGSMAELLTWAVATKSLSTLNKYPYTPSGYRGACPAVLPGASSVGAVVTNGYYTYNNGTEEVITNMVASRGAVIAGLWMDSPSLSAFMNYKAGIFNGCTKTNYPVIDLNVVVVGYGTTGGVDYWLLKFYRGTQWGENGYMRLKRGVGACGIGYGRSLAVVDCAPAQGYALDCEEGDESCGGDSEDTEQAEEEEEEEEKDEEKQYDENDEYS